MEVASGEKMGRLEDELARLRREKGMLSEALEGDGETVSGLRASIAELNQEQESLLTLLQEMELKLKHYKKVVRACGQAREVSESEDEEEEGAGSGGKLSEVGGGGGSTLNEDTSKDFKLYIRF